jgi:hypothetical protein
MRKTYAKRIASLFKLHGGAIVETAQRDHWFTWSGFALIVLGFLGYLVSYFWLDVLSATLCFNSCAPGGPTAGALSSAMWADFSNHPGVTTSILLAEAFVLLLANLPFVAAVVLVGCSLWLMVSSHSRALVKWLAGSWLIGFIPLLIAAPFIWFFPIRPGVGYGGMFVSYVLMGISIMLIRVGLPEPQRAQ